MQDYPWVMPRHSWKVQPGRKNNTERNTVCLLSGAFYLKNKLAGVFEKLTLDVATPSSLGFVSISVKG